MLFEPRALDVGVVEFRERVGDLHPRGERLEALRVARVGGARLGERRHLDRIVHEERRLDEFRLDERADEFVNQSAAALRVGGGDAERAHSLGERRRVGAIVQIHAGEVGHRVVERKPRPGPREADDLAAALHVRSADGLERDLRHERLHEAHHVVVVRVGFVGLQQRELRVVVGVYPFVAEDAPNLVDLVHSAHDEALQVEFGGDAEEEVAVQRLVMRLERLRHRARRDRSQHGRVHLQIAPRVEERPYRRQGPAPRAHRLVNLAVGDQIEVALAIALLDVAQAVIFLGGRTQRLRQQRDAVRAERRLARLRPQHRPGRAHEVAEVEVVQEGVAVAERVAPDEELQFAFRVLDVGERRFAHSSDAREAPRDRRLRRGLPRGLRLRECAGGLRRRMRAAKSRGIRIHAALAQPLQLGAAACEQLVSALGHRPLSPKSGACRPAVSTERRRSS